MLSPTIITSSMSDQRARELISARKTSHKYDKDVPDSPTVTNTWQVHPPCHFTDPAPFVRHLSRVDPGMFGGRSVMFSSRWYLCARKGPYGLHLVSQTFLQRCRSNGSNVRLIDDGPLSYLQGRSSSASSFK